MKLRTYDKIFDILSVIILLGATLFVFLSWKDMPEQIPSHYNFKGEPDAYGGKGILIFTLVMGWVLVMTMLIVERLPQFWNTGVERNPANEAAVNRIIRDMLGFMNVSMAVLFSYMLVTPVTGYAMGRWFMPVFLGVIFGTIMFTVVRLIRNR